MMAATKHGNGPSVGQDAILPHVSICQAAAEDRLRFYRGRSMLGTFRPGDYLTLEAVPIAAIRPGDVVVYRGVDREGEPDEVVHRVVAAGTGGLVARGDNNPCSDSVLVTADNLLGRVSHVERDGKVRSVRGGRWGLLRAWVFRTWRLTQRRGWRLMAFVGRWPYRGLRSSGLVRRLWRPAVVKVRVETENGPLVKFVCGQRTVARWWPQTGRFQCRKPYDLIIRRPGRGWLASR